MFALAASTAACSKPVNGYTDEHKISTSPAALECGSEATTLQFEVSADASWQAYADDDCSSWVSDVDPAWSASEKGTVSFKVAENLSRSPRSGSIVIKCGTTRHKLTVTQAAFVPEETAIQCPLE